MIAAITDKKLDPSKTKFIHGKAFTVIEPIGHDMYIVQDTITGKYYNLHDIPNGDCAPLPNYPGTKMNGHPNP